ncbi:PepSY domain-containing protein [Rhodoferax sp.]|uniref:PepSY domain-containing protein n=1 Tax=Rhodoferax sp. TaxID=50421 RepID=UPI002764C72D|nr:peptidase [Rhodoferax sp.]
MQNRNSTLSWRTLRGLLCAAVMAFASATSMASEDHDRARKALEAGEVLPLRTILERVEREHAGQVIDVELEREREGGGGRWIYEIKLLRTGGALVKLKLDARDGTLISRKGQERRHDAPPPRTPPASKAR